MSTPAVLYSHSVADGTDTVLKRQPVLGSVDLDAYTETLLWAKAGDGTDIPISVVFRKDLHRSDEHGEHGNPASTEDTADGVGADEANGRAASAKPLLLYGYGSYEASMDPYFSVSRLSLLDRGVVFAIAHVRGGGEMGRHWYDQGKTTAKKNTFTDSSTSPATSSTPGGRVRIGSWPAADRPGACSWVRLRTWRPSSSPESAPTCPLSTR